MPAVNDETKCVTGKIHTRTACAREFGQGSRRTHPPWVDLLTVDQTLPSPWRLRL